MQYNAAVNNVIKTLPTGMVLYFEHHDATSSTTTAAHAVKTTSCR